MGNNDYWPCLKESLSTLYKRLEKSEFLDQDCPYLENSYKIIEKLWQQQYYSIKTINYIMLSEAPLFGDRQSYFYNERAGQTQFFYYSNLEAIINHPISSKSDLIKTFNQLGIIIFDVFPFAFNNQTAMRYGDFTKRNRRSDLVDLTYENHIKPKLELIVRKATPDTKLFYRYKRVKNIIDYFMIPTLMKFGFNINGNEIPTISKKGGGIDQEALKKIIIV